MKTTPTFLNIGDGIHPVSIESSLAAELRSTITDDREIYLLISRYGPTTRPIAEAKQVAMALENRSRNLPFTHPGAWRFRRLHFGNQYESGYCRHLGQWTASVDPALGRTCFTNEAGELPTYDNAEFWPG